MSPRDIRGCRPSLGIAYSAMVVASLLVAVAASRALAEEPWEERESEPRLILAGNREVHEGERIELQWTPADSIRELEILLSVDGGRHYSRCISPQLDPRQCRFVWRVPPMGGTALRMRIRYNRGGREIEGAPTEPLYVTPGGGGHAEPMGLPAAEREHGPRPAGGRGQSPAGRAALGTADAEDEDLPSHHRSSESAATAVDRAVRHHPAPPHAFLKAFAPPRVLPLRA